MSARVRLGLILMLMTIVAGCTFAGLPTSTLSPPGFFHGFWHGLLAPWTLILRWFLEIKMYAIPNSGWFYDFGFLLGVGLSLPIGWLAALVTLLLYLFL